MIGLNSDLALGFDIKYQDGGLTSVVGQECGLSNSTANYECDSPYSGTSATFDLVKSYADNNTVFLSAFASSFLKMTTVGYSYMSPLTESKVSFSKVNQVDKLGTLEYIDLDLCI